METLGGWSRAPVLNTQWPQNLEYVKAAVTFTWGLFMLTYRLENNMANVCLDFYDSPSEDPHDWTILPSSCIVAPICWEIPDDISSTQETDPVPLECPAGNMYVQYIMHGQLLHWIHTCLSAGHPGIQWATTLLNERLLWPTLNNNLTPSS